MLGANPPRSNHGTSWTERDEAMLAELWSMDTPIMSIANVLGRTQETIRWKARSLGLKGVPRVQRGGL